MPEFGDSAATIGPSISSVLMMPRPMSTTPQLIYPIIFKKQEHQATLPQLPFDVRPITVKNKENYFLWDGDKLHWVDLKAGHLTINFNNPQLMWRLQRLNRAQEPLLRALAWHSKQSKKVWDITAGLGRDGMLLAYAGFIVTLFEKNPVLQALLSLALKEWQAVNTARSLEPSSIHHPNIHVYFRPQDSLEALQALRQNADITEQPDYIYMDPMYPERRKKALVKKELRIIRNLVGEDDNSEALLTTALQVAKKRVVVKRPIHAPFVGNRAPHHSITAPNTRFDVYRGGV